MLEKYFKEEIALKKTEYFAAKFLRDAKGQSSLPSTGGACKEERPPSHLLLPDHVNNQPGCFSSVDLAYKPS